MLGYVVDKLKMCRRKSEKGFEMKSINADIASGNFSKLYLLYGEERYLINQFKKRLCDALLGEGDAMNFHTYQGGNFAFSDLIGQAETMPFFAERRVILIEEGKVESSDGEQFVEYLKNPSPTTYFVIVQEKADKRSKFYKAATKVGRAVEFQEQTEQTLIPWISKYLAKENQKITGATASYLLQKVGVDMENLSSELYKLSSYCMGREEITRKDVDDICITNPENRIFNMMDAIAEKEQKKAMYYYRQMVELKEPPMRILFMLTRQFNILLQVHELTMKGFPPSMIAKKLGIRDFVAKRCANQVRGFTGKKLKRAVEDCIQANVDIKSGNLTDVLAIELIIVRYSTK